MSSHPWNKQTYTYKNIGNLSIQADVFQAGSLKKQPVIIWIHGGALIFGDRASFTPGELAIYLNAGYTVVSIDYRLAPETKLPEIIEDVKDAIQWVYEKGADLFAIAPDQMAVIGHSAGGYLALMTGFCANPLPKAIVSFYGYGDIIGPWYSQPDPFYCQLEAVPKDEAYGVIGQIPLAGSAADKRFRFYLYCRQHGLWPQEVAGQDPHQNPAWFSQYCPVQNVTAGYVPSLLIHGDQDTDVPYEQSVDMAGALEKHHVNHQLLTVNGRGHGLFNHAEGDQDPVYSDVFSQVTTFLRRYCVKPKD